MANIVFNQSLGLVRYYGSLPAANDALILVPLESSGLVADATMKDYDTLTAVLAGASNEQTTAGRKSITSGVAITVDDTNDWVDVDMAPDPVWAAVTASAQIGALLMCYDPDTTTGDDSSLIPMLKWDWVVTPNGGDITGTVTSGGFFRTS